MYQTDLKKDSLECISNIANSFDSRQQ